jgi:hypothetical protein
MPGYLSGRFFTFTLSAHFITLVNDNALDKTHENKQERHHQIHVHSLRVADLGQIEQ